MGWELAVVAAATIGFALHGRPSSCGDDAVCDVRDGRSLRAPARCDCRASCAPLRLLVRIAPGGEQAGKGERPGRDAPLARKVSARWALTRDPLHPVRAMTRPAHDLTMCGEAPSGPDHDHDRRAELPGLSGGRSAASSRGRRADRDQVWDVCRYFGRGSAGERTLRRQGGLPDELGRGFDWLYLGNTLTLDDRAKQRVRSACAGARARWTRARICRDEG
jgi:hypothetical protein